MESQTHKTKYEFTIYRHRHCLTHVGSIFRGSKKRLDWIYEVLKKKSSSNSNEIVSSKKYQVTIFHSVKSMRFRIFINGQLKHCSVQEKNTPQYFYSFTLDSIPICITVQNDNTLEPYILHINGQDFKNCIMAKLTRGTYVKSEDIQTSKEKSPKNSNNKEQQSQKRQNMHLSMNFKSAENPDEGEMKVLSPLADKKRSKMVKSNVSGDKLVVALVKSGTSHTSSTARLKPRLNLSSKPRNSKKSSENNKRNGSSESISEIEPLFEDERTAMRLNKRLERRRSFKNKVQTGHCNNGTTGASNRSNNVSRPSVSNSFVSIDSDDIRRTESTESLLLYNDFDPFGSFSTTSGGPISNRSSITGNASFNFATYHSSNTSDGSITKINEDMKNLFLDSTVDTPNSCSVLNSNNNNIHNGTSTTSSSNTVNNSNLAASSLFTFNS